MNEQQTKVPQTADEAYADVLDVLNGRRMECKAFQLHCERIGNGWEAQVWDKRIGEIEIAISLVKQIEQRRRESAEGGGR